MSETMTAEQAASKLTNIMHDDHYAWHPSILTAFGMAVDALRGAEGDCISRADVNRVIEDWFRTVFGVDSFRKTGLCRELRELPSAQPTFPQRHENDHIAEVSKMDCISRQGVIDTLNVGAELLRRVLDDADIVGTERAKYEWGLGLIEAYISDMKDLPSAQPEIVRCKDCKYWTHIKRTDRYWCKTDDGLYDLNPSPDDFCSRAERRTDEA